MYDEIKSKGTLVLDSKVFYKLHQELINHFGTKYKIDPSLIIDYQLYGFNEYDENLPSIKKMVDEENKLFLNGKYLYNKWRQFKNGVKFIKISREYSFAYFHCLAYRDVYDFLDRGALLSDKDKKDQLAIVGKKAVYHDQEFYLGYYIGENKSIIKTKLTISPGTRDVEWILYYWENDELSSFEYYGTIVDFKNIITIFFRKENSKTERDAYMSIYYGNEKVIHKPFLKGLYAGYDINDRPVSGEIIFQRVNSLEIQDVSAKTQEAVNPIIENYLLNRRLIIEHTIPQNLFELSNYSQYVSILERIEAGYSGVISTLNGEIKIIDLNIRKTGKITLLIEKTLSYQGYLQIDNNDSIFIGRLLNSDTDLKLSIVLNGNIEEKVFITGYFMGSYEKHSVTSGKFCVTSTEGSLRNTDIQNELQYYKKNDKTFSYSDLFKRIISLSAGWNIGKNINNRESDFIEKEFYSTELNLALKKIAGDYYLVFSEKETFHLTINLLIISLSGNVTMFMEQLTYFGDAQTFSSGLLALNFTTRNNIPYYSQIITFVGKHSIEAAKYFKGVANFLDNDLKPASFDVFLIPKLRLHNTYDENIRTGTKQHKLLLKEFESIGLTMN